MKRIVTRSGIYAALLVVLIITLNTISYAQALRPLVQKVQDAQKIQSFEKLDLFNISHSADKISAAQTLNKFQLLDLDQAQLQKVVAEKNPAITLSLPYLNKNIKVNMVRVNLFTDDFRVVTDQSNDEAVNYEPGVYYQGMIDGDDNSVAAISIFNDHVMGIISNSTDGNLVLGCAGNESNQYMLYSDLEFKGAKPSFECATYDDPDYAPQLLQNIQNSAVRTNNCVRMYFEIDNTIYQQSGNSISATTNWMTGVYNNIAAIYNNESVGNAVCEIYIWTAADPYTGLTSFDQLNLFKNTRTSFNGDVGELVGIDQGSSLGGLASAVNGLCYAQYKYCYADVYYSYNSVPTYSWTVQVCAHELGHLLGSFHTHNCTWPSGAIDDCGPMVGYPNEGNCANGPNPVNGGTIMSYCHLTSFGINFANGFGQYPGSAIRGAVDASNCLGTQCTSNFTFCTDNYEPNEERADAAPIAIATNLTGFISSATDKDWFSFSTTTTEKNVEVTLFNLPADYDLFLYSPTNDLVSMSANSGTNSEVVACNSLHPGVWKVLVTGKNNSDYNATACYTIKAMISEKRYLPIANGNVSKLPIAQSGVVFPNPSHDESTITFSEPVVNGTFDVYDLAGRLMQHQAITTNATEYSFNAADWLDGVYMIIVSDDSHHQMIQKFIKD